MNLDLTDEKEPAIWWLEKDISGRGQPAQNPQGIKEIIVAEA